MASVYAQSGAVLGPAGEGEQQEEQEKEQPKITDYKIISIEGDTITVDTTLTIQKEYSVNYLRKDNFGLLPFSNIGQPYTQLTKSDREVRVLPDFGASAAHANFYEVKDIFYYRVPTPFTELFFKTTFEQGQLLDAFFTSNLTPQLNFSAAYKGLHSLGKYQHLLTSQGSFRTTISYHSKRKTYGVDAHFLSQDLSAEQNGGLTELADQQFSGKDKEFRDRNVLDVNYEDAERKLRAKRFYVNQYYNLIKGNDSTANNRVQLRHVFNFTDKEYYFKQEQPFPLYGSSLSHSNISDLTEYQEVSNQLSAGYLNNILGEIQFKVRHTNYNYGYKRVLYLDNGDVPNRLKGDVLAVGAAYKKNIGGFELKGDALLNTIGDFDGNYLKATASYRLDSLNRVEAGILTNSRQPDFNVMLYQSDYKNYNWYHELKNEQRQTLHFKLQSQRWLNVDFDYSRIHNYTYFEMANKTDGEADSLLTPRQYGGDVHFTRIKVNKEIGFKKMALDNTLMFQEAIKGKEVFHVSPFITRNTLYYQDYWFRKSLYVQTGFIFNYFSSYKVDGYDPVMAEFYVQDRERLKGFTRLDFFLNAKVRTARMFFKLENITTLLDGNGHYATLREPYRDWSVRFGMVWNFFW